MASGDVQAVVPWVFFYELASVCARKVRARRLDAETVALFFELLTQSGFQLDLALSGPGELYAQAMAMGCQVADSIYLGVAKAQDLPLATVDGGLRTAARSAGVELWKAE
jgi:predicted nucleic acid-binding protein